MKLARTCAHNLAANGRPRGDAAPSDRRDPTCTTPEDIADRVHRSLTFPAKCLTLTQIRVAMFSFCPHGDQGEQGMNGRPDCRDPTTVE
jgi:hypothetical protein